MLYVKSCLQCFLQKKKAMRMIKTQRTYFFNNFQYEKGQIIIFNIFQYIKKKKLGVIFCVGTFFLNLK